MNMKFASDLSTFYINTMKMASITKDKNTESKNLYLLSFFGLLRMGCPYQVTEEKIITPDLDDRRNCRRGAAEPSDEDAPKRKVISIVIDRKGYSCDETELIKTFGSMYEELIRGEKVENYDAEDSDDIVMPHIDFTTDLDNDDASKIQAKASASKEAAPRLPYILNDTNYPDDRPNAKEYDTFLFDSHSVTLRFADGETHSCTITVYPLDMLGTETMAADIIAIAVDEQGRIRAAMSDTKASGNKSVNIEYDFATFVVRADWKRGRFGSTVALFSTPYGDNAHLASKTTHIVPTKRTSSYFMRIHAGNGNYMNVFPLQLLRNDPESGLASAVIMIEDGQARKIYSMESDTYLSLWFDNGQKQVSTYWQGNFLNAHIQAEE